MKPNFLHTPNAVNESTFLFAIRELPIGSAFAGVPIMNIPYRIFIVPRRYFAIHHKMQTTLTDREKAMIAPICTKYWLNQTPSSWYYCLVYPSEHLKQRLENEYLFEYSKEFERVINRFNQKATPDILPEYQDGRPIKWGNHKDLITHQLHENRKRLGLLQTQIKERNRKSQQTLTKIETEGNKWFGVTTTR